MTGYSTNHLLLFLFCAGSPAYSEISLVHNPPQYTVTFIIKYVQTGCVVEHVQCLLLVVSGHVVRFGFVLLACTLFSPETLVLFALVLVGLLWDSLKGWEVSEGLILRLAEGLKVVPTNKHPHDVSEQPLIPWAVCMVDHNRQEYNSNQAHVKYRGEK